MPGQEDVRHLVYLLRLLPISSGFSSGTMPPRKRVKDTELAFICARFLIHQFKSPMAMPRDSSTSKNLVKFISTLIRRAALEPSVPYAALLLLQRLKTRYPTARATGHFLYFAAFLVASKVLSDTDLTVRSWLYSAQWSFSPVLIGKMERELCQYLDWDLTFDYETLSNFQKVIHDVYGRCQDVYPEYSLLRLSRRMDPLVRRRGTTTLYLSGSSPSPHTIRKTASSPTSSEQGSRMSPPSSPVNSADDKHSESDE
ncbi:alternative cyclin Pcl12 [Coprinopsis cinerea okayama7|uniref:Alternative cyclin Pcl12 n=1 Tax=Coprinopsis cinerea (strain Okayama-7 / 130 / ATCC MYA-4618 / FGSC 9003) TaxID=240176 RepID=A8N4P6_COPC7|nr:alternative cyclin Pcl12 [Coprinopsis cinerea okayama7\|eukprot:XP_001829815.2 alternative cyclin Pcl12 [Coprinopsis cinerea okayama7\